MRFLTDSAADYEWDQLEQLKIDFVPVRVYFGEEEFPLQDKDFKARFYEKMRTEKAFPHTSQPSPQDYLPFFEDVKEKGESLIAVLLSSALSGTYQSALLAKDMVDYDNIHIVDSRSVSVGIQILVDKAQRMHKNGETAKKIAHELSFLLKRIRVLAIIDNLDNLYRGGRLSRMQVNIGKLAHLKPIIMLSPQGKIEVQGRYMGRNKADTTLLNLLEEDGFDPEYGLNFVYAENRDNCDRMIEKAKDRFGEETIKGVTHIGPTIGAHVGFRAYGIFYVVHE